MHCFVQTGPQPVVPSLVFLLSVLLAVVGGAQQPTILSEDEYLSVLNESHPAVRDAAEAVALAAARVVEVARFENPVLDIAREDPDGAVRQTDLLLSWQLPDAARGAKVSANKQKLEAAEALSAQQLLTHRIAMKQAYSAWAVAAERQLRLSLQAERVERLAERESVRSENGEVSGLEAHRLRLAAGILHSRVAIASAERERARSEAAAWYPGLSSVVRPALPEPPALRQSVRSEGALPEPVLSQPVLAAEAELQAARLARDAAGRFVRSPELSLGWQRQETGPLTVDGPIVGLAWSIPLFDRKQAARQAADATVDGAQARLEIIERQVSTSLAAAWKSFAYLTDALARARQELTLNGRMLDGAEAAFVQGEAGLTDLLETHRSVTEAELAVLDLHEAALAAHREIDRLSGSPGTSAPAPTP